jgi:oligopeptide transport system substrate-binding protein
MTGNTTRRGFLASAGGAALLFTAGCGQNSPGKQSSAPAALTPGVFNFGNGAEPASLDPHHVQGTWEFNIVGEMLLGLTTEDPRARPVPGAAERWETSPDGRTWTFHLRDHLWSDGQRVTAHDFIYAWRRILDPKSAAQYASLLYVFRNAEAINGGKMPLDSLGAKAIDDHTIALALEHPAPYILELMMHQTTYPVPQHVVETKGDAWTKPGNYVGNGPYLLREWVPNDHITLDRNPKFYDAAKVKIERVVFYPTSDANAALKRFRAGEFDVQGAGGAGVPLDQLNWIKQNLPDCLQIGPYLGITYIVANQSRKPFDDVRVREALNLAYDRETVTGKVIRLGEPPAYTIVPPGVANYPNSNAFAFKSMSQAERVKRAQDLMRQAGYGPENRLRTTYSISDTQDAKRVAAVAQQMWKQAYIDVDLLQSEVQVNYKKLQTGDFDLGGAGWIADYNDAYNFLFLLMSNDGGFNYGRYRNPRFDELMARSNEEPDAEKRGEVMSKAEAIALSDFAIVPTRYPVTSNLVRPYVKGWAQNNRDFHRIRYVSIDEATRAATIHT